MMKFYYVIVICLLIMVLISSITTAVQVVPTAIGVSFQFPSDSYRDSPHTIMCSWKVTLSTQDFHRGDISIAPAIPNLPSSEKDRQTMGVYIVPAIADVVETMDASFPQSKALNAGWKLGPVMYHRAEVANGSTAPYNINLSALFIPEKPLSNTYDEFSLEVTSMLFGIIDDSTSEMECSLRLKQGNVDISNTQKIDIALHRNTDVDIGIVSTLTGPRITVRNPSGSDITKLSIRPLGPFFLKSSTVNHTLLPQLDEQFHWLRSDAGDMRLDKLHPLDTYVQREMGISPASLTKLNQGKLDYHEFDFYGAKINKSSTFHPPDTCGDYFFGCTTPFLITHHTDKGQLSILFEVNIDSGKCLYTSKGKFFPTHFTVIDNDQQDIVPRPFPDPDGSHFPRFILALIACSVILLLVIFFIYRHLRAKKPDSSSYSLLVDPVNNDESINAV